MLSGAGKAVMRSNNINALKPELACEDSSHFNSLSHNSTSHMMFSIIQDI
jgi:hypothetical protein